MKQNTRFIFLAVLMLAALALSACGPSRSVSSGGGKVEASMVEFTGQIEAMNGSQWTVSGQVITVDPSVVRDGPFAVGDTVKVEARVAADGTLSVTGVESPSSSDNSNDANDNDDMEDDDSNSNDANANDDDTEDDDSNSNDANSNDDDDDQDDDSNGNGDDEDDDSNSNGDDDDDEEDDDDSNDNSGNSNGG
jgi:hypothetical protein